MRPMMARMVHTIPIGNLLLLNPPNSLRAQRETAPSPYPPGVVINPRSHPLPSRSLPWRPLARRTPHRASDDNGRSDDLDRSERQVEALVRAHVREVDRRLHAERALTQVDDDA